MDKGFSGGEEKEFADATNSMMVEEGGFANGTDMGPEG